MAGVCKVRFTHLHIERSQCTQNTANENVAMGILQRSVTSPINKFSYELSCSPKKGKIADEKSY